MDSFSDIVKFGLEGVTFPYQTQLNVSLEWFEHELESQHCGLLCRRQLMHLQKQYIATASESPARFGR